MNPLLGAGPHVLTVHGLDLDAIQERVRRALRVGEGQLAEQSAGVVARVDAALARARTLPAPRGAFATVPVRRGRDGGIEGPPFLREAPAAAVEARLLGAWSVSAYVVTLGQAWHDALEELCSRDEAPAAWFLDQVANSWIDEAARQLERILERDQARVPLRRTGRLRPGYRGHPALGLQAQLCRVTDADRLGVQVNEAGALTPTKTVTGIVGWEPDA